MFQRGKGDPPLPPLRVRIYHLCLIERNHMNNFLQKLYKIEEYAAASLLSAATLLIFVSAVTRTFDLPLNWALDLTLFLFAWSVFLGADVAMRRNNLVNVDLLVARLPVPVQRVCAVVSYILILVFLGALTGYGFWLSYASRARAFQGIPWFSYTWVALSVPVGSILMIITTIRQFRAYLKEARPPAAEDGEVL
ncbi:Tripartite ATP-independent periplasmic transporter DctQ component [Spirochaeta thermophila DSM 6578]|uniref:Tripartite ATP-independent periplasmic transporter DctQ component n=2 Tax=Winmispira thermophila TaxID=154 RepID=G0GEI2_WINT7|nr:Tripartite ATP-independent periplasmic transporter DctQ component [Spirochaeta thermophila DSM 6578]